MTVLITVSISCSGDRIVFAGMPNRPQLRKVTERGDLLVIRYNPDRLMIDHSTGCRRCAIGQSKQKGASSDDGEAPPVPNHGAGR
jgi:hypothetical protein